MKTIKELDDLVNEMQVLIPDLKHLIEAWDVTSPVFKEYVEYLTIAGVLDGMLNWVEGLPSNLEEKYIFWSLAKIYRLDNKCWEGPLRHTINQLNERNNRG